MKLITLKSYVLIWFLCFGFSCGSVNDGTDDLEPSVEIDLGLIVESVRIDSFIDQAKLTWGHHEHSYRYEIRYTERSQNMTDAILLETEMAELLVSDLEPARPYDVQMRVQSGSEWTEWSDIIQVNTAEFKTRISAYNVLSAQYDHLFPGSTWADRRLAVLDIITQPDHNPDVLTVQELMDPLQAEDLSKMMAPVYDAYISEKDVSSRAIFWKKDMYRLVDSSDFDILGNEISGYATTCVAAYVRLEHMASGRELLVFNIHLPWGHNSAAQHARHTGAQILSGIVFDMTEGEDNLYVLVPGDYNNYPETVIDGWPSSPLTFVNNGFKDTFHAALFLENADYGTTNDILAAEARIGEHGGIRVDYIFGYPYERIAVSEYKTIINFEDNSDINLKKPVPSDHHPVSATVHLSYER